MTTRTKIATLLAVLGGVALAAALLVVLLWPEGEEFRLVPVTRPQGPPEAADAHVRVGTGWGVSESPETAVRAALDMALGDPAGPPSDFAILYATSGSDLRAILAEVRKRLGAGAKIFGGTSDVRGVMTNRGYIRVSARGYEVGMEERKRGVSVMTVTSREIIFGTGAADFAAYPSAQEAAKAAVLQAIQSAGKTPADRPRVVLTAPTIGEEEEVLAGIETVVGRECVVLGGTVGGPKAGVFGDRDAYERGVSLAVLYTDLPLGWTFEGGFDVTEPHSGTVTRMAGQTIVEIDGRPALDVYDEWLGGRIRQLFEEAQGKADLVRDLLTLRPLYRKYQSSGGQDYFLFSHPWPRDPALKDRAVSTSTKIREGERVYLSRGSWETLVNRIGNLPRSAKVKGGIGVGARPAFGIAFICGGVLGTFPESEREKLPILINQANGNAPFISNFTWGEQGHFPGVGNKHGNLLSSFLVIGQKG